MTPHRRLAIAILLQALHDAHQTSDPARRSLARHWFSHPDADLRFWCSTAEVSVERIQAIGLAADRPRKRIVVRRDPNAQRVTTHVAERRVPEQCNFFQMFEDASGQLNRDDAGWFAVESGPSHDGIQLPVTT